jgi:hypothetical protein
MTDQPARAARSGAQATRQARLERARRIRRRIISGSVALFAAVWLLIAVVLVSGHDPALAKRSSTATTSGTTASSSSSGATTTAGSGSSGSAGSSGGTSSASQTSGSSSTGGTVSSVTTQQS